MKVLHIIDSEGLYGAEIMLLSLIEEQIKIGIEPCIVSIGEPNCGEKDIEKAAHESGYPVKKIRFKPGPNYLGALKLLRRSIHEGFDLLHSHGYKGDILFGFIPKKIRKIPLVTTLHGWTSTEFFSKMNIYKCLDKLALNFIDAVVLVNKGMMPKLNLKNICNTHYYIVNNGLPMNFNSQTVLQDESIKEKQSLLFEFCKQGFIIGSIGRLSKEKGYEYLIRSLNQLRGKYKDIKLVFIGEGNQKSSLEKLIYKYHLTDYVFFAGYCKNAKKYFSLFDVYVLSSITEGLPMTLLEAMSAKVPIVATNVGGVPNVICDKKEGFIIESRNPENITEAVEKIYLNKTLAENFINNAYKKVTSSFSSNKMAQEYSNIYNKLLNIDRNRNKIP